MKMRSFGFFPTMTATGATAFLAAAFTAVVALQASAANSPTLIPNLPAEHVAAATASPILAAQRVGHRIVAVGDHGAVLLSDDDGKTFRQAAEVPTRATLTSVYFTDARNGWAVGHWGAIVRTADGGEHWTMQRNDISVDRPLFSVYFKDDNEGWAVGLWSLMLHTVDGGSTWSEVKLPAPPGATKADANLYAMVNGSNGDLFIAAERGLVLRSQDSGKTWSYSETGFKGSLWTALSLKDGTLLVGGLRGGLARSTNDAQTWTLIQNPLKASITGMAQKNDGTIVAVGLDGAQFYSRDDGKTFHKSQRTDRAAMTTVVVRGNGIPLTFTTTGPLPDK